MAKTKTPAAPRAPKGAGIGDAIREALKAGKTNPEILEIVKKKFPDASTSLASVNWYRGKMRAAGEKVPSGRELKGPAKPKTAAAPKAKKAEVVKKKPTLVKKPVLVKKKKVSPLD